MARKRPASELEGLPARPRRDADKRTKLSPSDDARSDSSVTTNGSISEDSALQSSPAASDRRRNSSMSSLSAHAEDQSGSSVTDSSGESSDFESDEEAETVTIGGPKKPSIGKNMGLEGAPDIHARLAALLPQLAAANGQLGRGCEDHNMEDVEEGEPYIEMDLGLGVLEERSDHGDTSEGSTSDDEDRPSIDEGESSPRPHGRLLRDHDKTIMDKLMGKHNRKRKPEIEELG